ncbi:hypothetical protein JCM3765_001050 [Sporobolomyces pararoseus]
MTLQTQIDDSIARITSNSPLLDDQAIPALVSLAQAEGLDGKTLQTILDQLMSFTLPRGPLQANFVLRIVSALGEAAHTRSNGSGRVEYPLQKRLLQQLVVLQSAGAVDPEGLEALRRCYAVLEKGLDYETLRKPTALLLSQIVQKQHATTRRLAKIQQLLDTTQPFKTSLRHLETKYRRLLSTSEPVLFAELTPTRFHFQNHTEAGEYERWRTSVERRFKGSRENIVSENGRVVKRRKLSNGPIEPADFETLARRSSRRTLREAARDLRESTSFIDWTDSTGLNSWAKLLDCGYGHETEYITRIRDTLVNEINECRLETSVEQGNEASSRTLIGLNWLLSLCEELPDALQPVLAQHFVVWDGNAHRSQMFELLPFLKAPPYQDLNDKFLAPLSRLADGADAEWISECVRSLTSLLTRWAIRDDLEGNFGSFTVYDKPVEAAANLCGGMQRLLEALDQIIETSTVRYSQSLELRLSALEFYEKSLDLSLVHKLPVVVVPSQAFSYLTLFSNEVSCISRMSGIIARLREALTGESTAIPVEDALYTEPINALNNLLVDFGNPLWKRQFLVVGSPDEANAGMGLCDAQLEQLRNFATKREQSSASALGLTTHGALASLAVEFLHTLARREGKEIDNLLGAVSTATLKHLNKNTSPSAFKITFTNFRPLFLEHLRDEGAEGFYEFLFSTMQSLIKRRESQGESQMVTYH